MEPLAALSPRASRCPAKPDTDGVATTVERFAPDIRDGDSAALRLRGIHRRRRARTSADFSGWTRGRARGARGGPRRPPGDGGRERGAADRPDPNDERAAPHGTARSRNGSVGGAGQAEPTIASRTIQMPVRSCTWVWMRDSSPV